MTVKLMQGDCIERMRELGDNSVDSVVTDPPYGLGFMGKKWDALPPSLEVFEECLRVLKPGGHLLAFGGSRTYHRLAVAVEDAGFEIRDQIQWVYGSGFPKSQDVAKYIDKLDASEKRRERQISFTEWMRGTGLTAKRIDEITGTNMGGHYTTTASQPAVATRDLFEMLRPHIQCDVPDWIEALVDERTVESENYKRRELLSTETRYNEPNGIVNAGRGADARTLIERRITAPATDAARQWHGWGTALKPAHEPIVMARKPLAGTVAANVMEYGTGAINVDGCRVPGSKPGTTRGAGGQNGRYGPIQAQGRIEDDGRGRFPANLIHDGSDEATEGMGDCQRYFYCAKASRKDRGEDNKHPTVKPTELMRYLCRLVTPPGGVVLDPFAGSGSTGKAAVLEGFDFIGIELDPDYFAIAEDRIADAKRAVL